MKRIWKHSFGRSMFVAGFAVLAGMYGINSAAAGSAGKIGVSLPTVEGPFFTSMLYGILDEAEKLGYEVNVLSANGYSNVDTQVSQIETLIAQKVNLLLVNPTDPTVTQRSIEQAVKAGIAVVGAGLPARGAQGSVGASHCDVGMDMAAGTKKLLPDGGSIGVLAGPPGAFWTTERLRCFKEALKDTDIKIVAERTSEPSISEGLSISADFLQRFPKLDLIYGADDTLGDGAAKAVEEANRCGKTKVVTAVFGDQAKALMEKGCLSYDVALQPVLIGRTAVRLARDIKNGNPPEQPDLTIPNTIITQETLNSVDLRTINSPEGWKPPL